MLQTTVLFVLFISLQYVSTVNTTFISLDPDAGNCVTVPVSVTSSFTLDINGYWNTNANFDSSAGVYVFKLNNFNHNLEEYKMFMVNARAAIQESLSSKSKYSDLSQNLLAWVSWSLRIDDGDSSHRLEMSGDSKVLLDRINYIGAMGNEAGDCHKPSKVAYDRATGRFSLTYSADEYGNDDSCNNIVGPTDLSYQKIATGDDLGLKWDGVSLMLARAVNRGVSECVIDMISFELYMYERSYHLIQNTI